MEHKLQVLSRPAGAPLVAPRILADASMSLSFALPSSYRCAHAAALAVASKTASTNELEQEEKATTAAAVNSSEGADASWEDRDWDAGVVVEQAAERVQANAETKEPTQTQETWGGEQRELDEWDDEETAEELPDDFPRLIVNLTRLQRQHFPPAQGAAADVDMMEVFHTVKTTLHEHFSQMAEVLFEQKSCFHCTYGSSRAMMDSLHVAYPDDILAMLDYPTEIDGIPLHEFLHTLSRPSRWKSVEYLKGCLRRCSRDIKWKMDVALELELLAEQEHAKFTEKQQKLSDEIDDLTRLRDSFRDRLDKMASQNNKGNGRYLMLRKLEDIETRLMALLDSYLQEPELEEEECYGAFGNPGGAAGPSAGMNVLDMVVAMVFGRLPQDFSEQATPEAHFQMLFDHHIHILRLWKKDFGRLPLRVRQSAPKAGDGEDQSSHEREEEPEEEIAATVQDVFEDEEEYEEGLQSEDFAAYCRVDDDFGDVSEPSFSKMDDWDAKSSDEVSSAGDSDGYGADFDSDESEDEEEAAPPASTAKQTQEEPSQEAEASTSATATKPATAVRPRRRRVKRSKLSKKIGKSKQVAHESEGEERPAPFQPFACTGAVGLLRLAKEKEMF